MLPKNEQTNGAKRILEALSSKKGFICLSALAKASGFDNAASKEFKAGLNSLAEQGIVKVRQSGWSSEERRTGVHEKTVILLSDVMEFLGDTEPNTPEQMSEQFHTGRHHKQSELAEGIVLNPGAFQALMDIIKNCRACKDTPVEYITQESVPVCRQHANMLADSDISFPTRM